MTPSPGYYRRNPLPLPGSAPHPGGLDLSGGDGMNEQDMAAHLARRLDPYSPMARAGQDRASQQQVAAAVPSIAAGQGVPRIGIRMAAAPAPRPGIYAATPTAPPAGMMSVPPTPAAPFAPVPGRDVPFVPSVIEPQKNTWRPNQGSATANWRAHPGMVPPPPEALPQNRPKAPPRAPSAGRSSGRVPAWQKQQMAAFMGTPAQPVAAPSVRIGARPAAAPSAAQAAVAGDLQARLQKAAADGDFAALSHLGGQMDALNSRGLRGLNDHDHAVAMQGAEREQVGARIGVMDRSGGGRIGIAPEQAYAAALNKTGDPAVAQEAMSWQRITQAADAAKAAGKPVQVNPEDAGLLIERKYPSIAPQFRVDKDGRAAGNLTDLFAHVGQVKPPGWDDPNSELAQAMAHRIRQMYGAELPNQTWVPPVPSHTLAGPAVDYGTDLIRNMFQGNFNPHPASNYASRRAATDWFNRISTPTR